jgi:hypothetical protein
MGTQTGAPGRAPTSAEQAHLEVCAKPGGSEKKPLPPTARAPHLKRIWRRSRTRIRTCAWNERHLADRDLCWPTPSCCYALNSHCLQANWAHQTQLAGRQIAMKWRDDAPKDRSRRVLSAPSDYTPALPTCASTRRLAPTSTHPPAAWISPGPEEARKAPGANVDPCGQWLCCSLFTSNSARRSLLLPPT